jgi:hypothetical protein
MNHGAKRLGKPETFEFWILCTLLERSARQVSIRTPHFSEEDAGEARPHQGRVPEETIRAEVDQQAWLRRVVIGHDNYYAVPTNYEALEAVPPLSRWNASGIAARATKPARLRRLGQIRRFAERFPPPPAEDPPPLAQWNASLPALPEVGARVREIRCRVPSGAVKPRPYWNVRQPKLAMTVSEQDE